MNILYAARLGRFLLAYAAVSAWFSISSAGAGEFQGLNARASADWIRSSTVYEIFPRQFSDSGNFAGITARLDELKSLGVDVIWLMPIHPIGRLKAKGTIGSPYAVKDYYAVNPDYGTKADLHELISKAHARGMKVIIDIVANHTAWDSVMMSNPGFYKQDAQGHVISPHPDWSDVAGLDYSKPATRRYMKDMLHYWVQEFALDGFRCDVAGEVPTDFWEEVRADLETIHPGLFMVAEGSKPELVVKAFDMDYAWPMMGTVNRVMMEGAPASDLRRTWEEAEQARFPKGALHLRCSDNHDEPRAVSRFGWKGAMAVSAIMFTLDGVPLIYNGMEVGDTSESSDPALFERLPVFWAPKGRETFRETYRNLISLRHNHPSLSLGSVKWLENSAGGSVVSFARQIDAEEIVTVVNLSNRPVTATVALKHEGHYRLLLPEKNDQDSFTSSGPTFVLSAYEWRIYVSSTVR